jgi:hypothetical protein
VHGMGVCTVHASSFFLNSALRRFVSLIWRFSRVSRRLGGFGRVEEVNVRLRGGGEELPERCGCACFHAAHRQARRAGHEKSASRIIGRFCPGRRFHAVVTFFTALLSHLPAASAFMAPSAGARLSSCAMPFTKSAWGPWCPISSRLATNPAPAHC